MPFWSCSFSAIIAVAAVEATLFFSVTSVLPLTEFNSSWLNNTSPPSNCWVLLKFASKLLFSLFALFELYEL